MVASSSATRDAWDHRTGSNPAGGANACLIRYPPAGDGYLQLQRMPASLRSGRWYTVRIQIFPDGRCGVAVDGQPLWRSDSPISLDRLYRVRFEGKSVRTRILVGPLNVWEGVRGDVDWSLLDRQDAGSRTPR